jgi:hemoglobin
MRRGSIYEAAGGAPAFLRLATAHHARCLEDPVLNHPFSHPGHPQHIDRLAAYWGEVLGGPPTFSTTCGGQSAMLQLHAGMGADDDLGDRFAACFRQAIDDAGLPDDPELRQALRDYMDWATAAVMAVSPEGVRVPDGLPLPHWTWDGVTPPPQPA